MWGRQTIDESTMKSHLKWKMPCSISFKYLFSELKPILKPDDLVLRLSMISFKLASPIETNHVLLRNDQVVNAFANFKMS